MKSLTMEEYEKNLMPGAKLGSGGLPILGKDFRFPNDMTHISFKEFILFDKVDYDLPRRE